MFLKQLFQYSKSACIIFVLFFLIEIFINYKVGYVATPANIFGMFSSPVSLNKPQCAYQLYVDGELINNAELGIVDNDILMSTYDVYFQAAANNKSVYESFKKLLSVVGLQNIADSSNLNPIINEYGFQKWFAQTIKQTLKKDFTEAKLYQQEIVWNKNGIIK